MAWVNNIINGWFDLFLAIMHQMEDDLVVNGGSLLSTQLIEFDKWSKWNRFNEMLRW